MSNNLSETEITKLLTKFNSNYNPDKNIVTSIKYKLALRDGFCCCKPKRDTVEYSTKCPCTDFQKTGNCICKLFVPKQ